MDSNYYAAHNLTIAKHPSETEERLMVRLIAFALFASDRIAFGKGLSDDEEPDLWQKDLTGAIELWIELACLMNAFFAKLVGDQTKWRYCYMVAVMPKFGGTKTARLYSSSII